MKRLCSCFAILLFLFFLSSCNSLNYNTESTDTATIVLIPKLVAFLTSIRYGKVLKKQEKLLG